MGPTHKNVMPDAFVTGQAGWKAGYGIGHFIGPAHICLHAFVTGQENAGSKAYYEALNSVLLLLRAASVVVLSDMHTLSCCYVLVLLLLTRINFCKRSSLESVVTQR